MVSKPKGTEGKIGKLDNTKIKELCIQGHYLKRQLTEWEETFANHLSDMGLILRVYKELLQLNNNNQIFKKGTKL